MSEIITNFQFVRGESDDNPILEQVLLNPSSFCDELHILSGYANSSMLKRHLEMLKERMGAENRHIKIHLLVGMTSKEGISTIEHLAFKDIVNISPDVMCSYMMCEQKPCHSKVYVWLNNGKPVEAYIGSANYSQNAIFNQIESLYQCDPVEAESYFQLISNYCIYCSHDEVEDAVRIVSKKKFMAEMKQVEDDPNPTIPSVILPLLDRTNNVHKRAGLNWGQRPNRERNQAYIPIPRHIGRSDFFPPKKEVFTLMTDDGYVMQCVAQGNKETDPIPKQLTTTNNNSEMGRYFRKRLGVPEGGFITKANLDTYGRSHVTVYKLDDGTYYMEFRKPIRHNVHVDDKTITTVNNL